MGPTASGKTALAIELANRFHTEIISVDSRQFYREMNIGTAKPTSKELAEAPHHFINNLSIQDEYSAGRFDAEACNTLKELFKEHDMVIAAGGSTLYYKAFLEGIDILPSVEKTIRDKVNQSYIEEGIEYLRSTLQSLDPEYYGNVDHDNPARMKRAIEVCLQAGKPFSSFLIKEKKDKEYKVIKIGIHTDRDKLYNQIGHRCEKMLKEGLLDEVESLYPYRDLTPLQTVGYSEFFSYMDGELTLEKGVELFKQHTRNYAKRQMTWFRKEKGIYWMAPEEIRKINYVDIRMLSEKNTEVSQ
jgi:tRNA dimethylallyltransferase